jgi:hypothetical protein
MRQTAFERLEVTFSCHPGLIPKPESPIPDPPNEPLKNT